MKLKLVLRRENGAMSDVVVTADSTATSVTLRARSCTMTRTWRSRRGPQTT